MTVQDYLTKLCLHSGLAEDSFTITAEEEGEELIITLQLPETESGLFIGYHGETLESIQRLIRISLNEELGEKRFRLNVNQYRQQRQDQLIEKVVQIAEQIKETGESYTFPYLPAHDRFIIHSAISEKFPELESVSEGEGKYRVLTIRQQKI